MKITHLKQPHVLRTTYALRRTLMHQVALVLTFAIFFTGIPIQHAAHARTLQTDQSLSSLIGLLLEADSLAQAETVHSDLKLVRDAATRASKANRGSTESVNDMRRARTLLRQLVDDPHGERAEFQEKIANALKLTEDYLAIGVDSGLPVRTENAFGLITTTFDTLQGTVSVNLPDDVAAGDTISGTVIAEPKGNTTDEQAKNQDSLNGYVVEVAKQETPTQKDGSKWSIPDTAQFIPVVLKNRDGKVVGKTEVPFVQGNMGKPNTGKLNGDLPGKGDYSTPPFGQAGRPVSVGGAFDGDFATTAIKLGNQTAKFLAESPRKAVVRSPANITGPATIEVNEKGKLVARCSYQSIGVKLAADKLNLIRGEQTTLTATLLGLDGVTGPVSLQLTNASPWVVRMAGGETQIISAKPEEFTGGTFTVKRSLTGVKAGGFSINAVVDPAMLSPDAYANWKNCAAGRPGGPGGPGGSDDGRVNGDPNGQPTPEPMPTPGPKPQPSPPRQPGPQPTPQPSPQPTPQPTPPQPFRGRFRVTLNGFKVNHQTYQGLWAAWDAITFFPEIAMVDASGGFGSIIHGGSTNTIGSTPENVVRGGSASPNGGLRTNDGFPTMETPWRRTGPLSSGASGTIPPTLYFEREIIQNTNAVMIIPTIWEIDGRDDLRLRFAFQDQIVTDRPALGRAIGRIIRGPQPLRLDSYLRSGASMGIHNAIRLAVGVPQNRPIGMQPERDQFGFDPQVLVFTFDSAEFMSRTDFGFGRGIVPVHYVDHQSFAGDYTMFFQVERVDPGRPCPENITSTFTGVAHMVIDNDNTPNPFDQDISPTVVFSECHTGVRITTFPPISVTFPVVSNGVRLGDNTTTVTMSGGGSGVRDAATGVIEIPITLHFQHTFPGAGPSELSLRLRSGATNADGTVVLQGSGTFVGGYLRNSGCHFTATGSFSPRP